jgi:signal transduction histidine kinase
VGRAEGRFGLRARVTAGATVILAATLVVAGVTAGALLHRALVDDADSGLGQRIDEVTGLTVAGELKAVLVPTGRDLAQVQVFDSSGDVIASTPGLGAGTRLDVVPAPTPGAERRATVDGARIGGPAGQSYRLAARTVAGGGETVSIYAVTSLAAAERAEAHLRLGLAIGLPVIVMLAAIVIWWVTGRALAPVDEMRAEVDRIQAEDLARRVHPAGGDSEIGRLGTTLNRMLDRLTDAAERQQLFAASASHELRSPLSAIRTELEVGLAYPERADWPKVAGDSLVEIDRLEALARDLRFLTRPHPAGTSGERRDLWGLVVDEIGRRQPARGVRYHLDGACPGVTVDGPMFTQALRNLLDNAERHATTSIDVHVDRGEDLTTLTVANDGPPIPSDRRNAIFEPFTRLDDARSLDSGGSGLGLAIARSALRSIGGDLAAADTPVGARFIGTVPSVVPLPGP